MMVGGIYVILNTTAGKFAHEGVVNVNLKRLAVCGILFAGIFATRASAEIRIKINERTVATDSAPYIIKNHTMVPVRAVSEALGCEVEWRAEERIVTIQKEEKTINLTIDKNHAEVGGESVELEPSAQIKYNRTYVPLRFVAETLGAEVSWEEAEQTVMITAPDTDIKLAYNEDELFWLARIIHAEAEGEPFLGKVAVGNVVLNRVESDDFPNTIYGVIFDRQNGVQFTPVANGTIYNTPSNECIYAADRALSGQNIVDNALYFCNPQTSVNSWIINNRELYSVIGKHNFYV